MNVKTKPLTPGEVARESVTERVEMKDQVVKKNNELLNVAKMLRRNMTKQEKHLWYDFLQQYPVKVYKQRIIDHYVADFYCHQARLVIELDGSQHYTLKGKMCDEARTSVMERYGLQVLRFSNRDVDDRFRYVCYTIDKTITTRMNELDLAKRDG